MSSQYKHGDHVPTEVLVKRLRELVEAVTKRPDGWQSEFSMCVPAELDRDADLVLSEVAARLDVLTSDDYDQPAKDKIIQMDRESAA